MCDTDLTASEHFLGDYVFSESLTQLLVVGNLPETLLDRPADGVSIHTMASLDEAEKLAVHPKRDGETGGDPAQALVLELNPNEAQFEQYLGRAVRSFPHRVLLHCTTTDAEPGPGDEAFFAFGFRKLRVAHDDGQSDTTVKWFEYRLSQYKTAPDWLNARFWANPDRFDADGDSDDYYDDEE